MASISPINNFRYNPNIQNTQPKAQNNIVKALELDSQKKDVSSIGACQTCSSRSYQDGSNDIGVSFKSPTRVAPQNAASAVAGHEQEHVSNNKANAEKTGGEVLYQTVSIKTDICPECKKVYVSGGVTQAATAYKKADAGSESGVGNLLNSVA